MGHELKPTPMTHAYKDGSHSYPWHSGRGKLSRHLLILIALFLNGCIAALALVVQWIDIPITDASLPTIGSMKTKYSYKSLLAPGASMLGSINGFISGAAIAALVTAYAKRRGLGQGISFNEIGHLSQLSSGGLPLALSRYAIFGLLFFTVDSLTRSSIVASLTPTDGRIEVDSKADLRAFSTYSDDEKNVTCKYGERPDYGYGTNCPIDDRYGLMLDAGVRRLLSQRPPSYTRDGVTYPSELAGIAGYVSTLTSELLNISTSGLLTKATPESILTTCVPRTIVTVKCKDNLDGTGMSWSDLGKSDTDGQMDTQKSQFCGRDGAPCQRVRQRPDYGSGTISLFADDHYQDGELPLVITATGGYATQMGTPNIYCQIGSREVMEAIQIRGMAVSTTKLIECADIDQPSLLFRRNISFMAQMAMQKQQGEDGRFEIFGLLGSNTTSQQKSDRVAESIEEMVAMGATEMYADLPKRNYLAYSTPYQLGSPKARLGQKGNLYILFCIPPLVYCAMILLGWLWLGFRFTGAAHWSPLNPVDMAIAGIAVPSTSSAKLAYQGLAGAPIEWAREKIRIRLAEVTPDRLGLSTDGPDVAPKPRKTRCYGGTSLPAQPSPILFDPKLASPMSGTLSSPYSSPGPDPGQADYNPYFTGLPAMGYSQNQSHV